MSKKRLVLGVTIGGSSRLLDGQAAYFKQLGYEVYLISQDHIKETLFCEREGITHLPVNIDNEINPRDYIGKFWIDSLVHDPAALKYIIKVMSADNICLGSDYPFPLGEHHPGLLIEQMNFANELKEKLLFKNANEWLGISTH